MGPLAGLIVVDATWGMPGGVATLLLSDNGARVIKVERPAAASRPGNPLNRLAWERGKQSIELDLTDTADRDVLLKLLAKADVFCESFGYGVADAMGLGYRVLRERFPQLIYCSITGYGQDGPWRKEYGHDCLVAAKLGVMVEQPSAGREGPIFLGHPHIDYGTGFIAAIDILAAVRARHYTKRGQFIDASLLDGLLAQSPMNHWWHPSGISYVETSGGKRTGFGRRRLITACFECADGEYVQVHTGGQGGFKRTMDIFGFGDITQTVTEGSEMALPLNDEEMIIAREYIPEAFKQRPRQEWVELFHAQDLAALPVLRPGEVLEDEQVIHAGAVMTVEHPTLGTLRQAGPPLRFDRFPVPTPSPAPPVGEHNDELRAFATAAGAWRDAGTEQPKPLKHALEGVRVLDFASFFASPYGAKILSDLGADVIMVEAPGGDQMRPLPNPFEASQRGKRNIVIDLKSADGRAVAHDLVRTADIVLHNQRPGKAEKLTIDFATLSKINPKLVYCYLPGYGSSGPKSHLKAFAPLISGFTGLLYEGAGAGNPPVRSVEGNEDYYNGLLGAVAMLTGLEHRARTGEGLYIESPQLHSSLFVTSHHFLGPQRQSLTARQLDHEQMGWGPLYRLYPTADDWICLACVGDACFRRLASALKLPAELIAKCETDIERRGVADDLAIEVGRRLAGMTSVAARDLLRANDVPCEIPATEPMVPSLFWQDWALESGRVFEHPESMHGHIREIGIYTRLSDTAAQRKGPAPRLGQHTREILGEMGYSPERVTDLLTRGVVHGENVAR